QPAGPPGRGGPPPRPPYTWVALTAPARLGHGRAPLRDSATRIAARYMGEERAEEFGARNGVPGELLVRVTVEKVVALKDLTG
ncbi:hypothetical protein ACFV2H_13510, partial [Streptomyces sp. NPDC059629]